MRRAISALAILGLAVLALISAFACGTEEPAVAQNAALDTFEVAALLAVPEDSVRLSHVRNRSNGDMAGESYGHLLYIDADEDELENAGRIGGWVGGFAQMGTTTNTYVGEDGIVERTETVEVAVISIGIAVDVYESEADAQRVIDTAPANASGAAFSVRLIGDASASWPRATVGRPDLPTEPSCPCALIFRVGHLVAAVGDPSRPGPMSGLGQAVGPLQISVAEALAAKMRRTQESGQR